MIKLNLQKIKNKKQKKNPQNVDFFRDTFFFKNIFSDGICQIDESSYSVTMELDDINYQLSSEDSQIEIFSQYCDFLNSLSSKTQLKLTVLKKKRPLSDLQAVLYYQEKNDFLDPYRAEMNDVISRKLDEEKNGYKKRILFTFIQQHQTVAFAKKELNMLIDRFSMFASRLGSRAKQVDKKEMLTILSEILLTKSEKEEPELEDILPDVIELKQHKNYLKMDDHYAKTIYLQEYPAELSDTFLYELLEIPRELVVTLHINPLDQDEAFDLVKTKLAFMEQQKVDEQKKALQNGYDFEMLSYDLTYSLTEAKELVDDLQNKGQKLFSMTGSIHFNADTVEKLAEIQGEISSIGRQFGFKIIELEFLQEEGLNTALPLGGNSLPLDRTLSTASTAIFIPFTISDLIQENGKYYGVNAISKNILSLDRKLLKAPNGFVLGTPGSGKSFSVKREIVNVLLRDAEDEVIIIDPEREYSVIGKNFNGEIIKIASDSSTTINPMDINENYGDDTDPVVLKSEFLISLFDLIIGGALGLSSTQKTLIDRVCRRTYETIKDRMPTFVDFYHILKEQEEEEASQLVMDLEIYIEGSLSVFSSETNVDITKRLVVYDIKDLGKQLKTMGMLIVLDQVWNRITTNRERGVRTWLYIDEMQLLFTNEYSENYFFELWSRARKWGAIPTGITQNVETLLLSDLARRMLSNSDFVMMLNQAKSDRSQLVRLFDISEEQEKFVVNSPEGYGLMVFGDTTLPFYDHFPKDTQLYKMMSTKPGED
ncbi:VirB4-like conjugal transfer ATPase, CD1110 family [Enterococcus villorum]|uniref:VirB4-like conjugal transfer ATPase, CD1110 family n=1 Tax=Enterococcus villorum TaxID=112904 RepID=UPI003F8B7DAD